MKLKIHEYKHGERDLWTALGPFLASREVHTELGGPIYSTEDTTWWVAYDERGEVLGFASLRQTKSSTYYDYAYVVPDRRGRDVFSRLAKERDKRAREIGMPLRTVIRAARWKHYRANGWTKQSERGAWIRAAKETP